MGVGIGVETAAGHLPVPTLTATPRDRVVFIFTIPSKMDKNKYYINQYPKWP
jgi:hypothetical protein